MFFLAIVLNLFFSYFLGTIFENIIVFFLSFMASIILNLEILSIFKAINETNILILEAIFFGISLYFYIQKKCPKPKLKLDFKRLFNSFLLDKSLVLLLLGFVFLIAANGFLAFIIPSAEADSQTYHFFRSYMFIKNHSLAHFETNDIRALIMPINSEIIYAWILAFKKNFWGYSTVSYFSYFLVLISGSKIMEKFKISYRKRLFSIFLFSSLAGVIIQMSTLQTDLIVGGLYLSSLALFLENKKSSIFFSSLAFALALGVKTSSLTMFFSLILIFVLIEILFEKNKNLTKTKTFFLFLILNFLLFSSYNYILNYLQFGNFVANTNSFLSHKFWGGIKGYIANLINFSFQMLDFTGFRWGDYLSPYILGFRQDIFNFLNINPMLGTNVPYSRINTIAEEQIAGFGILGFLVFVPMVFKSIYLGIKKKTNKRALFLGLLGLSFVLNMLFLARLMAYMIYSIRFVTSFICFSFIVLTLAYKKKNTIFKTIIIFFAIFYMIFLSSFVRRAPLGSVVSKIKSYNCNLETFEKNFFLGYVYLKSAYIGELYQTITTKYKEKKNIAVIKSKNSIIFYLKKLEYEGYKVDFLNAAFITKEKLKKYDLLILEDLAQDDNVFNPKDEKANYSIKDRKIIFKDNNELNCFFIGEENSLKGAPKASLERYCFSYYYVLKDKDFKQDFSQTIEIKELNQTRTIYYFTKI